VSDEVDRPPEFKHRNEGCDMTTNTAIALIACPDGLSVAEATKLASEHTDGALHAFLCWNDREYAAGHASGEFERAERADLIAMTVATLTGEEVAS